MRKIHLRNPLIQPPWRNRLARSAVNRKVGGSSPPGGETLFNILLLLATWKFVASDRYINFTICAVGDNKLDINFTQSQ